MITYTSNWQNKVAGGDSTTEVDLENGKRTRRDKNKGKQGTQKGNDNDGGKKTRRSSTKDGSTRGGRR